MFRVKMLCCSVLVGYSRPMGWEQADRFRCDWAEQGDGSHERVGVLVSAD